MSQCTFWCWVLTNAARWASAQAGVQVSMHLLVPGAYQLRRLRHRIPRPSVSIHHVVLGAYRPRSGFSTATKRRLNTPCGAGCLSTDANDAILSAKKVSIHRVVLGAYRRQETSYSTVLALTSQYTVWCWVLIDLLHSRARVSSLVVSIHRVVLVLIDLNKDILAGRVNRLNTPCGAGAYRRAPLQAAPQRRLLYGSRHRRFTYPDSPVSTASIRPHSCVILPLNGHAPPIAPTPSLAPTFDGLKPKSPPLSGLSQCPRVHSRLTAKPKQMRALKTPTSHSRVRASGAGDSRGARATAVADAMAHRSKSHP